MNFQIPEFIGKVLAALNSRGYTAVLVGGAVRDMLRGVSPSDFDIATNALPEKIQEIFKGYKIIETGIAHGTVTVMEGTEAVEVTAFRSDGAYNDRRRPESVSFAATLADDLSRRDFTVNAIAYDPQKGITDPFGGEKDLKNKIIRCVGGPGRRFSEDALRIMRGLRFAAVLGFEIEVSTAEAIHKNKDLLKFISAERLFSELVKLLCGEFCENIIMEFCDVFEVFIPEIAVMKDFNQHSPHHRFDVLAHTAKAVAAVEPQPVLRMAAFLHDIAKPIVFYRDETGRGHFPKHAAEGSVIADKILKRLKTSREFREKTVLLINQHTQNIKPNPIRIKKLLARLGEEVFFDLIKLQIADNSSKGTDNITKLKELEDSKIIAEKIIAENQCYSLKTLAVKGNDIPKTGREVGEALNFLLNEVIEGRIENKRKSLLEILNIVEKS